MTLPALMTVASTLWAPEASVVGVECASRSATARPFAAGCSESAKTCREGLPGWAGLVTGRVRATASREGSIASSALATTTWWGSRTPPGPKRYAAVSCPLPLYQSGPPSAAAEVLPSA